MFGFFPALRRRRPSHQPARHRRIEFESLERRYCLTAPAITSLQIDSIDDTTVSLSGYVSDESPETVEVDFFGAFSGSTSPNASGYFAFSADADWLGDIAAVAYDEESLSSDSAYVEVTSDVPTLDSLSVEYGEGTEFTITGQVIDDSPGGLTIDFTGGIQGTATTDASGYFTFTAADGSGYVDVNVADAWGQDAYDSVEVTGNVSLQIINFWTDSESGGCIYAEGEVTGADPGDLTVLITFLDVEDEVSLEYDGSFSWYWYIEEGDEGWLSATASDQWGNESGSVEDYVIYAA